MYGQRTARLRIESSGGSPINDYRVRNGRVEFRILDRSGHHYADGSSRWRALDGNDVQLHQALDTVVSYWLAVRTSRKQRA